MSRPPVPPAIAAMRATRGTPWRPPTRRTFLAMLGLGGAATIGLRARSTTRERIAEQLDAPHGTTTSAPRWIGHC